MNRIKFNRSHSSYYAPNYNYDYTTVQSKENGDHKMHGSRRVIIFCLLTTVLPTILIVLPLYLRNIKYADVMYKISDSEVIQIHKGQSSVFCERHSLKMNTTFNAFQMKGTPELSDKRKHIRLKKSMTLPDDTLEYWGFYLFKGATVELEACSRYMGSKILVVKGEKILNTCGIIDGDKYKKDPPTVLNQGHVVITLESPKDKKENIPLNYDEDNVVEDESWYEDENNNTSQIKNDTEKILENENSIESVDKKTFDGPLQNEIQDSHKHVISRRDIRKSSLHNPNTVLDAGVNHGGNAINTSSNMSQDSVSSFENSLYVCYHDNMIINNYFPHSMQCNSTDYLERTTTLKVIHNVTVDGYYYYIFYSDNDIVRNDIHVIFDIYKPTFHYVNMTTSKVCVNQTECEFSVGFFSDELVIVEVPTQDGLKNDDSSSILISVCHPRMSVYIIFPVSVLLMILIFAFL